MQPLSVARDRPSRALGARMAPGDRESYDDSLARVLSARLRVSLQSPEVEENALLVADDPGIVAGGHMERVTGAELSLASVVHLQSHPTLKHVTDVIHLARVSAGDGLHVRGPAPPRLEGSTADSVTVEVDKLDPAHVIRELANLIRALKALPSEFCHGSLLTSSSTTRPYAPQPGAATRVLGRARPGPGATPRQFGRDRIRGTSICAWTR